MRKRSFSETFDRFYFPPPLPMIYTNIPSYNCRTHSKLNDSRFREHCFFMYFIASAASPPIRNFTLKLKAFFTLTDMYSCIPFFPRFLHFLLKIYLLTWNYIYIYIYMRVHVYKLTNGIFTIGRCICMRTQKYALCLRTRNTRTRTCQHILYE
jgi:hypothetical protein